MLYIERRKQGIRTPSDTLQTLEKNLRARPALHESFEYLEYSTTNSNYSGYGRLEMTWKNGSKGSVGESVILEPTDGEELSDDPLERFKFSSTEMP